MLNSRWKRIKLLIMIPVSYLFLRAGHQEAVTIAKRLRDAGHWWSESKMNWFGILLGVSNILALLIVVFIIERIFKWIMNGNKKSEVK